MLIIVFRKQLGKFATTFPLSLLCGLHNKSDNCYCRLMHITSYISYLCITVAISEVRLLLGPTNLAGQWEDNKVSKDRRHTTLRSGSSLCTGLHSHSRQIPENHNNLKDEDIVWIDTSHYLYTCAHSSHKK
ncbi:hypothetical protein E2C01_005991 [Portunus trituberculatus]|uniref:Uncharacterized protein n=1 Tax=Portunus trituberculatus TaxID=210409 RepID=A0A5B7CWY3_PORTR|nr:hypothetical protein [Portunus trituberculatus]